MGNTDDCSVTPWDLKPLIDYASPHIFSGSRLSFAPCRRFASPFHLNSSHSFSSNGKSLADNWNVSTAAGYRLQTIWPANEETSP